MVKRSSNLNFSEKRTILNRISNLARVNLTHTLGVPSSHSQATICFSFWVVDQRHSPRLQRARPSLQSWLLQHKFKIPISTSEWKVCPLAEPISYLACRVPYLRHVASTFKRLINTTTHCGLSTILSTQTDFHHETS